MDAIFEGGELADSYGSASVQAPRGDADLCAETEFASVSKLGRSIVQYDCGIHLTQELLGGRLVVRDDCVGMM